MSGSLIGKIIVLGVSGSISSYKAAELSRLLIRDGASVFVVMSSNAGKFVTPLTFQALTGNPVYENVFQSDDSSGMDHIRQAEKADLFVLAPASLDTIAKLANGLADDALSTFFVAFDGLSIISPAMNEKMWSNPAVQDNLEKLRSRGIRVLQPAKGELACGKSGFGRLPEPIELLKVIHEVLIVKQDLSHLQILITAGPTREAIDPVRFISNRASGKMGYALAQRAAERGARVILATGPCNLQIPQGVEVENCETVNEMADCVLEYLPDCNVVMMTAAVGDFAPEVVAPKKIKKNGENSLKLKLHPTRDILQEISENKSGQTVVGFAAETENVIANALEKFIRKKLDIIVANDISRPGIGFGSDDNQVTIIQGESSISEFGKMKKIKVADILLNKVLEINPH